MAKSNARDLVARFLRFVPERPPGQCWLWTGCLGAVVSKREGTRYGSFEMKIDGKFRGVASGRAAWLVLVGPIQKGLVVRHICDNALCVNPAHLCLGTHQDNMNDRRERKTHFYSKRTQCNHGHPFTKANTYYHPIEGYRKCRECRRLGMRGIKAADLDKVT